jgi:hypothetical protein
MLAFKSYLLKTSDYFETKKEIEFTYDVVLANCDKLVKNLDFMTNEDKVTLEISYKESPDDNSIMNARTIKFAGGKLKVNWLAGERYEIRDINKGVLKQRLNLKDRKWCFQLTNSQFSDVKKLSGINSDKIINIDVKDGQVTFSESSAWELDINEIEHQQGSFILNKRFLKCINDQPDEIEFNLFDSFILVNHKNSQLMLSYEQDFQDEDI